MDPGRREPRDAAPTARQPGDVETQREANKRSDGARTRSGVRGRARGVLLVCVLFGLPGALAACSSDSPGRSVASLPGHGPAAGEASASASPSQAQSDRDIVNFTRCLRAHGVNEPDPSTRPGHSGLSFELPPNTAANHPAVVACDHFVSKIFAAKQAGAEPRAGALAPRRSSGTPRACAPRHRRCSIPGPQGQLNLGQRPGDHERLRSLLAAVPRRRRGLSPPAPGGRARRRDRAVSTPVKRATVARGRRRPVRRRGRGRASVARRRPAAPNPPPVGTATVVRTNLATTVLTEGTLGYTPSPPVVEPDDRDLHAVLLAAGTRRATRARSLFRVDDEPVVLMSGGIPAWRPFAPGMTDGPDVEELEVEPHRPGRRAGSARRGPDRTTGRRRWPPSSAGRRPLGYPATGSVRPRSDRLPVRPRCASTSTTVVAGPAGRPGRHALPGDDDHDARRVGAPDPNDPTVAIGQVGVDLAPVGGDDDGPRQRRRAATTERGERLVRRRPRPRRGPVGPRRPPPPPS